MLQEAGSHTADVKLTASGGKPASGRLQRLAFAGCLLTLSTATWAQTKTILWRTSVNETGICSLSGRQLKLPEGSDIPVRVWAGIVTDPDGGPDIEKLKLQHLHELAEQFSVWKQELSAGDVAIEVDRRIQHSGPFDPVYFDVVVIQTNDTALRWFVDDDLDGVLDPRGTVGASSAVESFAEPPDRWLRLALATIGETADIVSADPPAVQEPTPPVKPSESILDSLLSKTQRLQEQLSKLDEPTLRKQHLSEIVTLADELIPQLERQHGADSIQLADPLYRKGRALAYRELPDVVARDPISNPSKLNRDFEATFQRLQNLVDVTQPQFVLLAVRRERRRGYYGAALDLLDIYRRNHPHPDWYHKKRSDLLRELNLPLLAHQAAADLWLHGTRPDRPIPVIFIVNSPGPSVTLGVSWMPLAPWRSDKLLLRQVSPSTMEGVAWLPINVSYKIELSPNHYHQFRTDAAMINAGSIVTLSPISNFDE